MLNQDIVEAAATLVANEGWGALSVRRVGDAIGKSGNAIHQRFKGSSLQEAVITCAFADLIVFLEHCGKSKPQSPADLTSGMVTCLREDIGSARLMVQVVAFVSQATLNQVLLKKIARTREAASKEVALILDRFSVDRSQHGHEEMAEALISWYIVACVTLVTGLLISDSDLMQLRFGFRSLL